MFHKYHHNSGRIVGSTASWVGDHSQTTLWQIDKNLKSETGQPANPPTASSAMASPPVFSVQFNGDLSIRR
jgi:hypothetical protein